MICSRCQGSNARTKAGGLIFCAPCATLLASSLPDPYWPTAIPRDQLQLAIRKALGFWTIYLDSLRFGGLDPLLPGLPSFGKRPKEKSPAI